MGVASSGGGGGDASAANQTTEISKLTSIDTKTPALASGRVPVDGSGVTQPVSASALPLPSGAATAAAQTTGNASLASIDGKVPAAVNGRIPVDGSGVSVTLTQTRVTLTAGTSTALIAANASRKSLRWQNTGTNPMTCAPGTGTVTAGAGMNYDPAASSSNQGGGTNFGGEPVPTNAFACISTAGTTVTVWEGN